VRHKEMTSKQYIIYFHVSAAAGHTHRIRQSGGCGLRGAAKELQAVQQGGQVNREVHHTLATSAAVASAGGGVVVSSLGRGLEDVFLEHLGLQGGPRLSALPPPDDAKHQSPGAGLDFADVVLASGVDGGQDVRHDLAIIDAATEDLVVF
jgi:hypothetical protein